MATAKTWWQSREIMLKLEELYGQEAIKRFQIL